MADTFLPADRVLGDLLPGPVAERLPAEWAALAWQASPMEGHALVLATFASLIAPFGGFFASGFKRALRIKVRPPFAAGLLLLSPCV